MKFNIDKFEASSLKGSQYFSISLQINDLPPLIAAFNKGADNLELAVILESIAEMVRKGHSSQRDAA